MSTSILIGKCSPRVFNGSCPPDVGDRCKSAMIAMNVNQVRDFLKSKTWSTTAASGGFQAEVKQNDCYSEATTTVAVSYDVHSSYNTPLTENCCSPAWLMSTDISSTAALSLGAYNIYYDSSEDMYYVEPGFRSDFGLFDSAASVWGANAYIYTSTHCEEYNELPTSCYCVDVSYWFEAPPGTFIECYGVQGGIVLGEIGTLTLQVGANTYTCPIYASMGFSADVCSWPECSDFDRSRNPFVWKSLSMDVTITRNSTNSCE